MSSPTSSAGTTPDTRFLDRTYRKMVLRILPFIMALWILAWMDRSNIGFAKLEMQADLGFSAAVYGLGAGIFYVGYLIFEVPSNLYMQKIGARKTIARIVIGWGAICALTALVTAPWQFYLARFALGAFEAGFYPGIIIYLTLWFPAKRRAKIFGIFMAASALSGVFGGPLAAFLMTHLHGALGLQGWQWIFLGEGIPTVLAGITVFWVLVDRPSQARWLSDAEKAAVQADMAADAALHGGRSHALRDALRDPRLWIFTAIYFLVILGNASVAFWGPAIIQTLTNFDITAIGWIISAVSLCGAVGMVISGTWSDANRNPRRVAVTMMLFGAAGYLALAFIWTSVPMLGVIGFACALIGAYSVLPSFWQMPNLVFAGTAAAGSIAIINSFGNLGGFIAPYALGLVEERTGTVFWGLIGVGGALVLAAILTVWKLPRMNTDRAVDDAVPSEPAQRVSQ